MSAALALSALSFAARADTMAGRRAKWVDAFVASYRTNDRARSLKPEQCQSVLEAARALIDRKIEYDSSYFPIAYPLGDVPADKGVCADVVVRSFRAAGIDLQALVHGDMQSGFAGYPQIWKAHRPDPSIDHRRVPNLMRYLWSHASVLPISRAAADYAPCDIVAWDLGGGVTHIGVVTDKRTGDRRQVAHHLSGSPLEEDVLFEWRIIGHFAL